MKRNWRCWECDWNGWLESSLTDSWRLCPRHRALLDAASQGSVEILPCTGCEEVPGSNYETTDFYWSREAARGITEIENMLRGISNG